MTNKGFDKKHNTRILETLIWKTLIILMVIIIMATELFEYPGFWSNYLRDIVGPAFGYIIVRGKHRSDNPTFLTFKFTPISAAIFIIGISVLIEMSQYLELYDSHFDLYDFPAYFSGVLIVYLIDKWFICRFQSKSEPKLG